MQGNFAVQSRKKEHIPMEVEAEEYDRKQEKEAEKVGKYGVKDLVGCIKRS